MTEQEKWLHEDWRTEVQPVVFGTPEQILHVLNDTGAAYYPDITASLDNMELSDEVRSTLQAAAVENIMRVLKLGHFNDLQGAQNLLEKLGITELHVDPTLIQDINGLLVKLELSNLVQISLRQSGKAGQYNIEETRKILLGTGNFTPQELTNDHIRRILDLRHLLMHYKRNQITQVAAGWSLLNPRSAY